MLNKYKKGDYNYANYKKILDLVLTVFLFALSIGLFITGLIATGSKKNLLTIVAILGILPASKMLISFIMSLRVRSLPLTVKEEIDKASSQFLGFYHMYFTSYEKNFYISHLILKNGSLLGLSLDKSFNENDFKNHLLALMAKEGLKPIHIKIFNDKDKYINRLYELVDIKDTEDIDSNKVLIKLLKDITL